VNIYSRPQPDAVHFHSEIQLTGIRSPFSVGSGCEFIQVFTWISGPRYQYQNRAPPPTFEQRWPCICLLWWKTYKNRIENVCQYSLRLQHHKGGGARRSGQTRGLAYLSDSGCTVVVCSYLSKSVRRKFSLCMYTRMCIFSAYRDPSLSNP